MAVRTIRVRQNLGAAVSSRDRSPNMWWDCPWEQLRNGEEHGIAQGDDFLNFSQHVSDQDTQQYSSYIDTGVTITQLPLLGGILEVAGNDADNDEGSICTGGNTGAMAVIGDTPAVGGKLWFECRIKKASVANNALGFFVGLAEEGTAIADILVNDTGVLKTTADFLGFSVLQDDGDNIHFGWQKASQTPVELINELTTTAPSGAGIPMVADTYINLGFKYDARSSDPLRRLLVYVNNLEMQVAGTAAQLALATFPVGEELAMLLATKVGTAAESKFEMDWWWLAQLGNP